MAADSPAAEERGHGGGSSWSYALGNESVVNRSCFSGESGSLALAQRKREVCAAAVSWHSLARMQSL